MDESFNHPASRRRSLRVSLSFAFIALILLACLILGAALYLILRQQLESALKERLGDMTTIAAMLIDGDEHLILQDPKDMDGPIYAKYRVQFARFRAEHPDIRYLYSMRRLASGELMFVLDSGTSEEEFSPLGSIYESTDMEFLTAFDQPNQVHVMSNLQTDQWGTWLSALAPIKTSTGQVDGFLGMDIAADLITQNELRILFIIIGIAAAVATIGMIAGLLVSGRIAKPLLIVAAEMEKIQRFQLAPGVFPPSQIREVVIMETALENMKKGLRSFRRYVPADVVSQLVTLQKEAVLETSKETLTVFFSDLENFTGAAEKVGVEKISSILGHYFEAMTQTLQEHKATVDKFIGDSVMAFWNAPFLDPDHAYRACTAALACTKAVLALGPIWREHGLSGLRTRIGINTGPALVGNIGYAERLSYTALGDTVNLASRLESLNKYYGTTILISESTWKGLYGRIPGRLVDRVAVKGRSQAGGIYQIFDETPNWLEDWQIALDCYFAGDFSATVSRLTRLMPTIPDDGPSLLLIERCRRHLNNPPAHWTGVTVMNDK
jgi:class 3 adenylate cyclase